MESRNAAFRVGMFVTAGIIAILALIFFLSGLNLHPGIQHETYFSESVEGIGVGTAVRFRGVAVGQITDIGLAAAEYPPPKPGDLDQKVYQQVVVRFTIDPKKIGFEAPVSNLIAHGLRMQIEPQGITGLSYLEMSFVNPVQFPVQPVPWTPNSVVIPSIPSTLTQIQDAAERVMSSLSRVDLAKMVDQISSVMTALDQEVTTGDAHQTVAEAKTLLATLNTTVAQTNLPATSAAIRNLAGGPKTQQILDQLNQTTAQLAKVSAELPSLVASSQAAVSQADETTADLQTQLTPILQELKTTTQNLSALSAELSRNPSQLIFSAPPPPNGDK